MKKEMNDEVIHLGIEVSKVEVQQNDGKIIILEVGANGIEKLGFNRDDKLVSYEKEGTITVSYLEKCQYTVSIEGESN